MGLVAQRTTIEMTIYKATHKTSIEQNDAAEVRNKHHANPVDIGLLLVGFVRGVGKYGFELQTCGKTGKRMKRVTCGLATSDGRGCCHTIDGIELNGQESQDVTT